MKGLKEWNFGAFEGESEDLNPPLPYGDFFAEYGGEREVDFRDRLVTTMERIMSQDNHDTVLAVSPRSSLCSICQILGKTSKIGKVTGLKNCCILKFEYENGRFTLVNFINHDFENGTHMESVK